MTPTKEELAERYAAYPNERLFKILDNKNEYTPEAIEVVKAEVEKRKIDIQEVSAYITNKETQKIIQEETASIPLNFWEKGLFFFLWMVPLFGAFRTNYSEDGMLTKMKQSRFFSNAGIASLFLIVFWGVAFDHSSVQSVILLLLFFILTYYGEKKFLR